MQHTETLVWLDGISWHYFQKHPTPKSSRING